MSKEYILPLEEFKKFFTNGFWRAFHNNSLPLSIPKNQQAKDLLLNKLYESIIQRKYYPHVPEATIYIDKDHGVTRCVPVFAIEDYCIYYFCLKRLEENIAVNRVPNTFGGWSLGGKIREKENEDLYINDYGRFAFNPLAWSKAFGDFNARLGANLMSENFAYALEFDIANFYDSIRLDILENRIREVAGSQLSLEISLLFHFLNYWNRDCNFYNRQTVGLPSDALADCSRILANFHLQPYDDFAYKLAQRSGVQYFRFADDQFIFLNDPNLKPKLLHELSLELRRWGLNINQKKVHLWNRAELIEHRSFPIMAIFANDEDKKDPEKIRAFATAYLSIAPEKLKALWHSGFPLLKRLLWCDLNVLPLDQRTELFARYLADDFVKKANVSILDRIYSLLKPAQRGEFVSKLLDLAEKLIHNEFHFHLRRFLKNKRLDSSAVCRRLKEIS